MNKKPPSDLIPDHIYNDEPQLRSGHSPKIRNGLRIKAICDACIRYIEAGKTVPNNWVREMNKIILMPPEKGKGELCKWFLIFKSKEYFKIES